MPESRLLTPGSHGDAVRDLQRRLVIAGDLTAGAATTGQYCPATEQAVIAFQNRLGLRAHGRCDEVTWAALVEASWSLGDRVLYLASPALRGDDIAEVQSLLGRLGFDCGQVDGIYGPDTAHAVSDFQHNCGLAVSGSCGFETVVALQRLGRNTGGGPGIATVRESEALRQTGGGLETQRIAIGHFGGLAPVVRAIARYLRSHGADLITLDDPDVRTQAQAANRFEAEVFVGFEGQSAPAFEIAYYSVPLFTSRSGLALASLIGQRLAERSLDLAPTITGMRLPILRETRMPAIMITMGPVRQVMDSASDLASAIGEAMDIWIRQAHEITVDE